MVKSAERTADILELVAAADRALPASEVAHLLNLPRSSVHGLLHTLTAKGLLQRDDAGAYTIGGRLFAIASSGLARYDVGRQARPVMERWSKSLKLTCNLGVLDGDHITYIEKVQDVSDPIRIGTYVGAAMPAHTTAMGKVLVAHMPTEARRRWLDTHDFTAQTPHTRTSADDFEQDLDRYRRLGYAVDSQEFFEGVMCVAAPVRDYTGDVVASISVTGLASRLTGGGHTEGALGEAVIAAANETSRVLGNPNELVETDAAGNGHLSADDPDVR